jgi:hypothetical protein
MELELINHPKYGIIKDYRNTLFTKEPYDRPEQSGTLHQREPVDGTK